MPIQKEHLSVFLSSPSDLSLEREAVSNAITELNETYLKSKKYHLDLYKWETDVPPSIASSPQEIINNHIGDNYDIFLGLLWHRFGTPTREAQSGTEEEFSRAFERHQANPGSVEIKIYVKKSPPFNLDDIQPDQFQKVKNFIAGLGEKGCLYKEFREISELQALITQHLLQYIEVKEKEASAKFHALSSVNLITEQPVQSIGMTIDSTAEEILQSDIVEEDGLLEIAYDIQILSESFLEKILALTHRTLKLGEYMNEKTAEAEEINSNAASMHPRHVIVRMMQVANGAAARLNEYSTFVEKEFIPSMSGELQVLTQKMIQAYFLVSTDTGTKNNEVGDTIKTLYSEMTVAHDSIIEFRQTIGAIPRLSSSISSAKIRAARVLDVLSSKMASTLCFINDNITF